MLYYIILCVIVYCVLHDSILYVMSRQGAAAGAEGVGGGDPARQSERYTWGYIYIYIYIIYIYIYIHIILYIHIYHIMCIYI